MSVALVRAFEPDSMTAQRVSDRQNEWAHNV